MIPSVQRIRHVAKRSSMRWAAALAGVAMSVGLAGCGGTTPTAAAPTHPLIVMPGMNGAFQDNFNPFSPAALSGTDGLVYQPLFYFNLVGPQVYPLLGSSYHWSNGNRTLTVDLRSGVQWSDGHQFSSRDVVFTFDLLKKFPSLDGAGIWTHVTAVTASGPNAVTFQFKKADVPFATQLLGSVYILPQHIWSHIANPATVTNPHPVGTGPYLVHSFSTEVYTFTANPHYWGGEPKVRLLKYLNYQSSQSATLAMSTGKFDWTDLFVPHINRIYTKKSKYNHYWFSVGGTNMLYPNLKNPLLANTAVRQAISLAINRPQLTKTGEYGYEPPAAPTGLVPAQQAQWTAPSLRSDTTFQYDPAKAVRILEAAGFKKNSQGIFTSPSGQPLSFTLQVPAGWTDWDTDCSLITRDLQKIGIHVTVQDLSFGAYYSNMTKGTYQLSMSWSNGGPTPYTYYQGVMQPKNGSNFEGWSNPVTTAALRQYAASSNPQVQHAAIDTLEHVMVQKLPAIPLIYGVTWYEYSTKYFTGWPTAQNPYAQPAPYNFPAEAIVLTHLTPRK